MKETNSMLQVQQGHIWIQINKIYHCDNLPSCLQVVDSQLIYQATKLLRTKARSHLEGATRVGKWDCLEYQSRRTASLGLDKVGPNGDMVQAHGKGTVVFCRSHSLKATL